jgi:predicted Fe-Mo cluster-binding NifX family protein
MSSSRGRPAYYAFRAGGVKIFLAESATAIGEVETRRASGVPPELVHELDTAAIEPIDAPADT